MKTKMILASAVAAMLALGAPAFANDAGDKDLKAKFVAADTDKDGTLSQGEWDMAWPDKSDWYSRADTNNDRKVTVAEKQAFHDTKEKKSDHM